VNVIVEYFSKICRENLSHEKLTNGTARLLLVDFREISLFSIFRKSVKKIRPTKI